MQSLAEGYHISDARERLKLSREQLAATLGIAVSTLKRHEKAGRLDPCVALAVECLLRREAAKASTPVSPEERAERKFRERKRFIELKAEAGLVKTAPTLEEAVQRRVDARVLTTQMVAAHVTKTEAERVDAAYKESVASVRDMYARWHAWTEEAGPQPFPEPDEWNPKTKAELKTLMTASFMDDYAYEPLSLFISYFATTREVPQPDDPRYAHLFVYPYVPLKRPT